MSRAGKHGETRFLQRPEVAKPGFFLDYRFQGGVSDSSF